jgi:hypothetical protein
MKYLVPYVLFLSAKSVTEFGQSKQSLKKHNLNLGWNGELKRNHFSGEFCSVDTPDQRPTLKDLLVYVPYRILR